MNDGLYEHAVSITNSPYISLHPECEDTFNISNSMRIRNKLIRNRLFKDKQRKWIKKHLYLSWCDANTMRKYSERSGFFHATSTFRRHLNTRHRAQMRNALLRIRNNNEYDVEIPRFKRDADWLYF